MSKNINIKIKRHSSFKDKDNKGFSELALNFTGKDINHIIINSIKRVIQTDIPIFAFDNFTFSNNTTVFNNNYIKNHIRNIPVWGIENKLDEYIYKSDQIDEEDEEENVVNDDIDLSVKTDVDYSSISKLTMYLDYKNDKNEIVHATTDDCIFYYKEGKIPSPYYNPVQIVKLQPKQDIKFSVQANPGTNDFSSIYSPTAGCYFNENNEHDYDFIVESRGQLSEQRIIQLALRLIIKKLNKFMQNLPKSKGMEETLKIENEDHLLGNLLTYKMQQMNAVKFCGYTTPHPLNKEIELEYKLNTGNINTIFKEVVSYYENIFDQIDKEISKIK